MTPIPRPTDYESEGNLSLALYRTISQYFPAGRSSTWGTKKHADDSCWLSRWLSNLRHLRQGRRDS